MRIYKLNKLFFVFTCLVFIFFGFEKVNAASLYFSPTSGEHAVGSIFSASVFVSSQDQSFNATSGAVSFPIDKLQVVSISKAGSIISLWAQEPSFSNIQGRVSFEGVVLNPGFTGSAGKIITISFKVKNTGQASLNFSSPSILANDGKGTSILQSSSQVSFTLVAAAKPKIIEPIPGVNIGQENQVSVPFLNVPIINEYPNTLKVGEKLIIKGQTQNGHENISINLDYNGIVFAAQSVESDTRGNFVYVFDQELKAGTYQLWAQTIGEAGNVSVSTEKYNIVIEEPVPAPNTTSLSFHYLLIIGFLLLIIIILIFMVQWYANRYHIILIRNELKKNILKVENTLEKVFTLLKEEVDERVKALEQVKIERDLTVEENKIIADLKEDLDEAESFIKKRIDDLGKEIK